MRRSARLRQHEEAAKAAAQPSPPPAKRQKKLRSELPRPEFAYSLVNQVPVSLEVPDYSKLEQPLSVDESKAFAYSIYASRNNWLSGSMFTKYWSRKPQGKKSTDVGGPNARDKMTKLTECTLVMGPHALGAKLFLVREEENESESKQDKAAPSGSAQSAPSAPAPSAPAPAAQPAQPAQQTQQPQPPQPSQTEQPAQPEAVSKPSEPLQSQEAAQQPAEATCNSAKPDPEAKDQQESTKTVENIENNSEVKENPKEEAATSSNAETGSTTSPASAPAPGPSATTDPSTAPQPPAPGQGPPQPGPSQLPPPPPKTANSNQLVVYRLQQMAQRDPALSELMKEVASGSASPTTVARFQVYINKAREMDAPKRTYVPPPRKVLKSMMLAFEFDENSGERFLLPKQSIMECLPNEDILLSFLHVIKGKKSKPSVFTPITITIKGIPSRMAPSIERCFDAPDKVSAAMKEIIEKGIRAEPMHVWYQIEKTDAGLQENIKKTHPPARVTIIPKRPYKARNTKASEEPRPTRYPAVPETTTIAKPEPTEPPQQTATSTSAPTTKEEPTQDKEDVPVKPVEGNSSTAEDQKDPAPSTSPVQDSASVETAKPKPAPAPKTTPAPKAAPRPRAVPVPTAVPAAVPVAEAPPAPAVVRPKLNLPDINKFQIGPEGLPPLPPSLRNSSLFAGYPQNPTEEKKEPPKEPDAK